MIGRLKGIIADKQPPWLVIDVQGVGYEVEAPMSTFYDLPAQGDEVTLLTHLIAREDAQSLYGFLREAERSLFRSLIKVSGVGARMALAILSGMSADEFTRCVRDGDVTALTRLPGIGKKTAERLVVEMRDRLDAGSLEQGTAPAAGVAPAEPGAEAEQALVTLGYKPAEAARMARAAAEPGRSTEEIIRIALREAAR